MRQLIVAVVGLMALSIGPATAGHPPAYPYVRFGFGYPFYGPYYSPWYGPQFGVGIQLGPRHPVPSAPKDNGSGGAQAFKLYVYPAAGQSEAQTADDRYQCHVWAAGQSGHDPTLGAGTRDEAESYTRALTACMEGRGYVVK